MFNYADNTYHATVHRWLDGDTVEMTVDLGQHVHRRDTYRLARIDAPETSLRAGVTEAEKQAGIALTSMLTTFYPAGTTVWISTTKADKYGRYLVEVFVPDADGWENLNDKLLTEGKVAAYNP